MNNDASSEIIGVISMVTITVILAAVIAAFVFGLADNVQKPQQKCDCGEEHKQITVVEKSKGLFTPEVKDTNNKWYLVSPGAYDEYSDIQKCKAYNVTICGDIITSGFKCTPTPTPSCGCES